MLSWAAFGTQERGTSDVLIFLLVGRYLFNLLADQQPVKEVKSPSGDGTVGVKGWNG